jgi:hypothetical protein
MRRTGSLVAAFAVLLHAIAQAEPLPASAECRHRNVARYLAYRIDLFTNRDTSHHYNLRFLADRLAAAGVTGAERIERLHREVTATDRRELQVGAIGGIHVHCDDGEAQLVMPIVGPDRRPVGRYLQVRLVAARIVETRIASGNELEDRVPLAKLDYTPIDDAEVAVSDADPGQGGWQTLQ